MLPSDKAVLPGRPPTCHSALLSSDDPLSSLDQYCRENVITTFRKQAVLVIGLQPSFAVPEVIVSGLATLAKGS